MSDTAPTAPTEPDDQAPLTVEVTSEDSREQAMARASRAILAHPMLRQHFPASDLWMVGFDVDDKDGDDPWFLTIVHDTVTGRSVRVNGPLDDPADLVLVPSAEQWPPTDDEFAWAVSVLGEDHRHRHLLKGDEVTTYRPMPPLANVELPDGTVERPEAGEPVQVVSEYAADSIVQILENTVTNGGLRYTVDIPGYRVAAKTGTAEVARPGVGYTSDRIVSVAGVAPAEDPEYAVIVTLGLPDTIKTSAAAAPTFSKIMSQTLTTFRVTPSTEPAPQIPLTW